MGDVLAVAVVDGRQHLLQCHHWARALELEKRLQHLVEELLGARLRDGAVAFDIVPQLAASGVLYDHVHVRTPVNRLVHAKKITTLRVLVRVAGGGGGGGRRTAE